MKELCNMEKIGKLWRKWSKLGQDHKLDPMLRSSSLSWGKSSKKGRSLKTEIKSKFTKSKMKSQNCSWKPISHKIHPTKLLPLLEGIGPMSLYLPINEKNIPKSKHKIVPYQPQKSSKLRMKTFQKIKKNHTSSESCTYTCMQEI